MEGALERMSWEVIWFTLFSPSVADFFQGDILTLINWVRYQELIKSIYPVSLPNPMSDKTNSWIASVDLAAPVAMCENPRNAKKSLRFARRKVGRLTPVFF